MKSTDEIRPLTSIRMFAAALVVLFHYYSGHYEGLLHSIVSEGHIGVTIFFVLSGFLITLRYYPAVASQGISRAMLADYFVKRFARIYPLYALILTLSFLARPDYFFQVKTYIAITMTQGFFDWPTYNFVPVAWTLTVEESFYLIAPLVFLTIAAAWRRYAKLRAVGVVLTLWLVGLVLAGWLLVEFHPPLRSLVTYRFMETSSFMLMFTLFGRFCDFAIGILAALLYLNGRLETLLERTRLMLALSLVSVGGIFLCQHVMYLRGGIHEQGWILNYPIALFACGLIVSLQAAANPVARLFSNRVLVYGGKISYAVYLVHISPLMVPVLARLSRSEPDPVYQGVIYLSATVISIVLYELVEKPARRGILALAARFKHTPAAS